MSTNHCGILLPVTQPPAPVVAVTNTILSPVIKESRPRDALPILPEKATPSRERRRSMIKFFYIFETF